LGKGTFGKVKEGVHIQTGEKVAIKIIDKSSIEDEDD
jgi:serine/threonine protein kinase